MNRSTKILALAALVSAAVGANAQAQFLFGWTEELAQLNNVSFTPGAANPIAPGTNILIPMSGTFTLEVWVVNTGANAITNTTGGGAMIGFATAVGQNADVEQTQGADWPIQFGGATPVDSVVNYGTVNGKSLKPGLGAPLLVTSRQVIATNTRAVGLSAGFGPSDLSSFDLASGAALRLFDVVLKNNALAPKSVWGDGTGEYFGFPVSGTSTSANNRLRNATTLGGTYTVEAVPEPGTMLALGAGLAALAARRRRK